MIARCRECTFRSSAQCAKASIQIGSGGRRAASQQLLNEDKPRPVKTASGKKLALSPLSSKVTPPTIAKGSRSDGLSGGEMCGYRLTKLSDLARALGEVGKCAACSCPFTVCEDWSCRRGLVSRVAITCSNPACDKKAYVSDPYSEDAKSVNARSVLGMCLIG